jgi:transposase InsO family protein
VIITLIDEAVEAGARVDVACRQLGLSARAVARWRGQDGGEDRRRGPSRSPAHALSEEERETVLEVAARPEFRNLSPRQIVPLLADRGEYVASESTFYRLLHEAGEMAHRGHARPAARHKPKAHTASAPNQVWSWGITYLRSAVRGAFFYLYLAVDVYSRKIVGWDVHSEEAAAHSSTLIEAATSTEKVEQKQLVLHADNGGPMKGSTMLATLQRLGVVPSFSRPSVSDDNPYSEALFRTLKYCPSFPRKPFRSLEEARAWVTGFVAWYNGRHLHSGIRYVAPADRHALRDQPILARRHAVYVAAKKRTPQRWTGTTRNWSPIGAVYLNPIKQTAHAVPIATPVS